MRSSGFVKGVRGRVRIAGSAVVCFLCLILPYRMRQSFVFVLHFILNGILVKLRLLLNGISYLFIFIILFPVYFAGIPVTVILRRIALGREKSTFVNVNAGSTPGDIFRMF